MLTLELRSPDPAGVELSSISNVRVFQHQIGVQTVVKYYDSINVAEQKIDLLLP
jgi:hypothetical protein